MKQPALLACSLLLTACGGGAEDGKGSELPNIVFVLADDLGWRDVGYAGSSYATPRIDRLAGEGLVFERAYSASPVCSPTRAAILTGHAPARIGLTRAIRITDYRRAATGETTHRPMEPESLTYLPESETTFAEHLRRAGYVTGFVGKWHLGRPPHTPRRHGFTWTSTVGYYSASPYFPPYEVEKAGDVSEEEYLTDHITEEALAFLREQRGGPFCLFVSHFAVHGPWAAKAADLERVARELDPNGDQNNALYGAMIASLDASIGAIVDELEVLELADSTLLIVTSDNGPTLETKKFGTLTNALPLRGGKQDLYEGGVRVPLIVRWPGHTVPGSTTEVPVVSMDFFPTILRAAGIASDESFAADLDGLDLAPLFSEGRLEREALYFHHPHRQMRGAVLRNRRKFIFDYRKETAEWYDLTEDPGELHDLAVERPAESAAARKELFEWLDRVGAGLVVPDSARE